MQTRDQQYAIDAYNKVNIIKKNAIANDNEKEYKSYGAFAHKLPILIRTAGLAQALSFVEARGQKPGELLLNDLAGTVNKENAKVLAQKARTVELSEYIRLTQQVMDALLWYKRFAQSVLEVDVSDSNSAIVGVGDSNGNI